MFNVGDVFIKQNQMKKQSQILNPMNHVSYQGTPLKFMVFLHLKHIIMKKRNAKEKAY